MTPELSRRELGILRGLASGRKLGEVRDVIARTDRITADHVRHVAARLYRKLGSETATGAVVAAIKAGHLPCPCPHHTTTNPTHPTMEGTNPS